MYDIGRSRRASKAFSFDEIALVPSRRTRGIEEVNLAWRIDAIRLDFPIVAAPMDSVMSPATAIAMGQLGGLGVLNLEGLWTRYADPQPIFDELAAIEDQVSATKRMQEVYAAPIQPELIESRMAEIRASGVPVAVCGLCWIVNRSKSRFGLKPSRSSVAVSLRSWRLTFTVTCGEGELE